MGDKKNIDRLFQERFKNFEAVPNDVMWSAIQSELDKSNPNKKRIPLWVMFSGVAAVLLLFIGFSVSLLSVDKSKERIVAAPKTQNLINRDKIVSGGIDKGNSLLVSQDPDKIVDLDSKNDSNTGVGIVGLNKGIVNSGNGPFKVLNTVVSTTESLKSKAWSLNGEKNKQIQLVSNDLLKEKGRFIGKNLSVIIIEKPKGLGAKDKRLEVLKGANADSKEESLLLSGSVVVVGGKEDEIKSGEVVFSEVLEGDKNGAEKDVVFEQKIKKIYENVVNEVSIVADNSVQEKETNVDLSKGLEKESAEVANRKMIIDSGIKSNSENLSLSEEAVTETECVEEEVENPVEKTIEEAIAELEENKDSEEEGEGMLAFNKWEIAPNIAPVYYNTLSSGSPIDSGLSGNKKKGKINMSYGIGVGYAINKKLTLRTGVNKVSLGFDTEDVAVNTDAETVSGTRGMKNIDLSPAAASLNIASSESLSVSQIPSSFSTLYNSSLNQRLGYLEVPVELSYKISDKKMKIDVIAGMSTFFLSENDIYTKTNGIETHIGQANNLNKISYSTNIGLGFNYNISKSFNFNFEPTFKYQLNAFSNDSGNFKPYILGVYTGLSFKF